MQPKYISTNLYKPATKMYPKKTNGLKCSTKGRLVFDKNGQFKIVQ